MCYLSERMEYLLVILNKDIKYNLGKYIWSTPSIS
jgi:hypothetical protein